MLKRIRGTVISFYQSRISKVLAPVIVAALTLLLFLSGSVRAYASSFNSEYPITLSNFDLRLNWDDISVGTTSFAEENTSSSYDTAYQDLYVWKTYNLRYNGITGYKYFTGQLTYDLLYDIQCNDTPGVNNWTFYSLALVEANTNNPRVILNDINQWSSSGVYSTFSGSDDIYFNFSNYNLTENGGDAWTVFLHFRVSWRRKATVDNSLPSVTNNWSIYINNSTPRSGGGFISDTYAESLFDIKNSLASGNSSILDILENDKIGTSNSMNSINSSYNSAQELADTAVDSAIHSYSNDLQQVEEVDFSSFFNTQRYGLSFWRSVGEFILDSSNLGYIATGLIVVTVINLFVFLLRL